MDALTNLLQDRVQEIVRSRARIELAERDLMRVLHAAREAGATQSDIAKGLAVSQAAVSKRLAQAEPIEGDDSPYDVALRYAAGELTHEETLAKLTACTYRPNRHVEGYDEPFVDVPGSVDELLRALDRGFLTGDEYDEILRSLGPADDRRD